MFNKATILIFIFFSSCAYGPSSDSIQKNTSNLTPGMITTTIEEGKSTKKQILEVFGPPDLITKEDGIEMWGYDKISRETAYGAFGLGFLGGGLAGDVLLGGTISGKQGHTSQSTKTVFLLVYFKENTVQEYKLSTTKF